jgi:hypothetical protein
MHDAGADLVAALQLMRDRAQKRIAHLDRQRSFDEEDAILVRIHAISPQLPGIEFYRRRKCYF